MAEIRIARIDRARLHTKREFRFLGQMILTTRYKGAVGDD